MVKKLFSLVFGPKQLPPPEKIMKAQEPITSVHLPDVEVAFVPPTEDEVDELVLQVLLKEDMVPTLKMLIEAGANWPVIEKALTSALRNRGLSPNRSYLKVLKIKERLGIA
jgi:hypothetical protein